MPDNMRPNDVRSRADLAAFLRELAHEAETTEVENGETWRYLAAASAWTTDCDQATANQGEVVPELSPEAWRFATRLLDAALVYE